MSFREEFAKIENEYNTGIVTGEFDRLCKALEGKTVVLFGAALIGDLFYNKLTSNGIIVTCFVDNYAVGITPNGNGPIINAVQLKSQYPDAMVIISNDKARDIIYSQLLELGFSPEQIVKYPMSLLATMTMKDFSQYIDGHERAYDYFSHDPLSQKIIIDRIRCYLFGESIEKSESPQYFEKGLIKLSDEEVFADGGFFTGDTAEEFIRQTDNKFTAIYGFEPDEHSARKVSPKVISDNRITIVPKGLYSENTVLRFISTGGTSRASGGNIVEQDAENTILISVTSIDDFFSDKEEKPTYIKLDIEGAEHDALLGMKNVIKENRPKLAICAYHKPQDIYDLRELISSFRGDYKFYLRHYANYFWETVLYAV
jgi:FkbM family methyltransferase